MRYNDIVSRPPFVKRNDSRSIFRNQFFLADFGYAPRYPICIDRYGLERVNFYLPLIRRQSEL